MKRIVASMTSILATRNRATWIAILLLSGLLGTVRASQAGAYLLGPQDKVKVRVVDWRSRTGEVNEWPALAGEYSVGPDGALALPLVGTVAAEDKTTTEVAATIVQSLRQNLGLSSMPSASVEVVEYRPYFVAGMVTRPGAYPFRPGLMAMQAISSAGGFDKLADLGLISAQRDALVNRGAIRTLAQEQQFLLAKQARLEAELDGKATIEFPDQLVAPSTSMQLKQILVNEQLLFEAHARRMASRLEGIAQTGILATREIDTLRQKATALQRQTEVTKQALSAISGLVAKGLAVTSRQLELDEHESQFESNLMDVNLSIVRATQELSRAQKDATELRDTQRNDVATELNDVRAKLSANIQQMQTAQSIMNNIDERLPPALDRQARMILRISRKVDGRMQTITAQETDPISPGDTISVERQPRAADFGRSSPSAEIVQQSMGSAP